MASSSGVPPPCSSLRAKRKCTRKDEDTSLDWANLPEGPAGSIAERLLSDDVADYVRFRAACAAWRACSVEPRAHSVLHQRFHPRLWVMLPSTLNAAGNRRLFLNVSTGERIRVRLPDPHGCYVLGHTAEGLVLLCWKDTYLIQLLNPLTGQLADLPSAAALLKESPSLAFINPFAQQRSNNHSPSKKWSLDDELEAFSLRSAGLAGNSTIAIHFGRCFDILAFAQPGDESWMTPSSIPPQFLSAFMFAGRFYCITEDNMLVVEITANQQPQLVQVASYTLGRPVRLFDDIYPVVNDGTLFICLRHDKFSLGENCCTYRANVETGKMIPTKLLDGHSLFVDQYDPRSILVPAGISPSIKPDTIYVCKGDDNSGRPRIDAFNAFGGRSIEQPSVDAEDIAYYLSCYARGY
ncbi:hypothetical protein EJB05_57187, partial [Eragrostis curvula]